MSRTEIRKTPVHERRFYLDLKLGLMEEEKSRIDEFKTSSPNGNVRKKTISGDELKKKLQNNEIK